METKSSAGRVLKVTVTLLSVLVVLMGYVILRQYWGQPRLVSGLSASGDLSVKAPDTQAIQPYAQVLPPLGTNAGSIQQNNPAMPAIVPSQSAMLQPMGQMMADDFFADDDMIGDHFKQMRDMMNQMMSASFQDPNDRFGAAGMGSMRSFSNSAKLSEDNANYVVKMNIPGLDKSDCKAEVRDGMLTVSGVIKEEIQNKVGNRIVSNSSSEQHFQRMMNLPGPVNSDNVKVDYSKDTLTITIPKA